MNLWPRQTDNDARAVSLFYLSRWNRLSHTQHTPPSLLLLLSTLLQPPQLTYLLYVALTRASETNGHGRPWPALVNLPVFNWIFKWFPLRIETNGVVLDPESPTPFLFACHPVRI